MKEKIKIGIIGVGYVGLPLAIEFQKKYNVVCYDNNKTRIKNLNSNIDNTLEVSKNTLQKTKRLFFTNDINKLKDVNYFIVTVPTPINKQNKPNLQMLIKASKDVGKLLNKGDIVIYESTVYPGCTEEVCVPLLEKYSYLRYNVDFYCGYSPERINPGDKKHRLPKIKKVVSGSNRLILKKIKKLYSKIISAGIHEASSIKIAEAAKVIENTQRDLNIALINELSVIFNKLKIDTDEVLKAAETKWNFMPFKPGLVGGHCIGVDPYYLTYKAESLGYKPKVILSGRGINESVPKYIVKNLRIKMKKKSIKFVGSKILIMGLTFKENCPDMRNSKVPIMIDILKKNGCNVDVFDPWINDNENILGKKYNLQKKLSSKNYDSIIIAVAHNIFKQFKIQKYLKLCKEKHVIYDLKHILPKKYVDLRL
jgi:UDP-N-acetyl-D-glucosamine/UDP-N-acetyl-D-galactosamine dehydrogenase